MKTSKFIISAFLVFLFVQLAMAQSVSFDAELKGLIDIVKSLGAPTAQNSTFQQAQNALSADRAWTTMDELERRDGEAAPAQRPKANYQLNKVLSRAENQRNGQNVTTGNFLNGEDAKYNYSLIEKFVKAQSSVSYSFKGREGRQQFVIIPFSQPAGSIKASLVVGKQQFEAVETEPGVFVIDAKPSNLKRDVQVTLNIQNLTSTVLPIAILNHNTRK